jgi:hypothetical protein
VATHGRGQDHLHRKIPDERQPIVAGIRSSYSDTMAQTMIESQDILDRCDRFQSSLVPLDIHILRQRY